jgi:hypothetical protein
MAAPKTNYLTQYNKYMGEFNKYAPYLNMFKGGNIAKNAAETALDAGISSIPVYGQAYDGIKLFNQVTGGINFNKMLGIKNPLGQLSSSIFGRKKTAEEEQAADPEYAKYMGMLSDMQNSSAATERSALDKRKAIQPMQEKAVSDYMDILQNGLSSRQLAPVYAAGEARNRAIGAGAEAGLMSQAATRGLGGGVRAGLDAAVQGNRNALSADLNSRITQQQIAARPGMLGQAANMTMSMENQVQQQLAQAAMERMNASQIGLSAYNANQQNERFKEQLADARKTARNTEMGALAGRFGPDIVKGIQGLLNKGKLQPGAIDAYTPDSSIADAVAAANPEGFGIDYTKNVPTPTEMPEQILDGFTMPTMRDAVSPQFQGGREMPVSYETSTALSIANPNAQEGQTAQGPDGLIYKFSKGQWTKSYGNPTIGGLNKKPFGMQEIKPDINDTLDMTGGMLPNTASYSKFW